MRKVKIKTLVASFLILILVFLPISPEGVFSQLTYADEDEDLWQDYENYIVIDHDEIWSGDIVYDDVQKPVVLVNGATLTIEKGANVRLVNMIVYDGRIVAQGTPGEKIVFMKVPFDQSVIPPKDAEYDPKCFMRMGGMIEFSDWVESDDEHPSVFEYVEFDGLGTYEEYDSENCPAMATNPRQRPSFFNTAYAEYQTTSNPALKFNFGRLRIENSTFRNNFYADIEIETENYEGEPANFLEVSDSNFEGNAQNIAVISSARGFDLDGKETYTGGAVRLVNNWYASPDGPRQAPNFSEGGEIIRGDYTLSGWSNKRFEDACVDCASNVLFLPGLEASRLYDGDNQLWEPNCNADVEKLFLNEDGKSFNENVYTKDVIDKVNLSLIGQSNIYKSFESDLKKWKNKDGIINDYLTVPYDWRLSLEDILEGGSVSGENYISYTGKSIAPYIEYELRRLASISKSGKVTIVAHSNGGLVAKALTNKLGAEVESLIDKIVLIAVPQVGTPQAVGGILHGFEQGLPKDWMPLFLSPKIARQLANNMPGAYNILPTDTYFNKEGSETKTPLIIFEDGTLTQSWIGKYGYEIDSADEMRSFLKDNEKKVSGDSDDLTSPSAINTQLLDQSQSIHQLLDDNWTVPDSISVYQIAGFGEKTLGTIKYWTGKECARLLRGWCLEYRDKILFSPKKMIDGDGTVVAPSALAMSEKENVKRFWVDLDAYNKNNIDRKHADILEVTELVDFIKNKLINTTADLLPRYISDSEPISNSEKRLHYILHSPLTLSVQDNAGHEISATNETILDARFKRFGEVQYVSVPASIPHTVVLSGIAEGSFTLEMQEVENDDIVSETIFSAIPSNEQTKVTMNVPDGTIQTAQPLQIDYDGNNQIDFSLQPKAGETINLPPLDQTPPEARIFFDTQTDAIAVEGIDENPTVVSYATEPIFKRGRKTKDKVITATITDQVGNTTVLSYTEKFTNQERRESININSISYDGTKTDFSDTILKYKWNIDKKSKTYKMFASHLRAQDVVVESHYRPRQDVTIIMVKLREMDDSEVDRRPVRQKLSGMIIPELVTKQGVVSVKY